MKIGTAVVVLLVSGVLAEMSVSMAQLQHTNSPLTSVTVMDRKDKYLELSILLRNARDYLYEQVPETRTNSNLEVTAFVDCSRRKSSVRFAFIGRPGEPVYKVTCDSEGHIQSYEKRSGTDVTYGKDIPPPRVERKAPTPRK
jgi:hypothetical protein